MTVIGIRESGKPFLLVESGIYWALELTIQLKESRITLTSGIRNRSSTDKESVPVPGIRNPQLEKIMEDGVETRIQGCFGFPYIGQNYYIECFVFTSFRNLYCGNG